MSEGQPTDGPPESAPAAAAPTNTPQAAAAAMPTGDADSFLNTLEQCQLFSEVQLERVRKRWIEKPEDRDPKRYVEKLVVSSWLTPWQGEQLLEGRTNFQLGSYRLLSRLGGGGMGEVFKAIDSARGQIVAIKVMNNEAMQNPRMVKRFEREIRAAQVLQHPNIVTAIDAQTVDGNHFLVMEFVEGRDLKREIRDRGALPLQEACEYIRQAALGLQHAFEKELIHRDLKPENLLLTFEGSERTPKIKITDMGVARFTNELRGTGQTLTGTSVLLGTTDYMAPEQAQNAREADIRADIYSLGVTFFELLTGRIPFAGESSNERLMRRFMDEPPKLRDYRPDLPPYAGQVLQRMMSREPDDRFQTPLEVAEAMQALLDGFQGDEDAGGHHEGASVMAMQRPDFSKMMDDEGSSFTSQRGKPQPGSVSTFENEQPSGMSGGTIVLAVLGFLVLGGILVWVLLF